MSEGRVRITNPLANAPSPVRRTVGQEIDESTAVGEVYLGSLIGSQWRAAVAIVVTLALTVGSLPIVFRLWPGLGDLLVLGIPVPWLVLSVAVPGALLVLGWLYVRQAERAESAFIALVEPREDRS